MPSKRGFLLLSWCLGLVSIFTQVMIIRELLVAFTGNELTIATSLALWLLAVAAGCLVFKRHVGSSRAQSAAGVLFVMAAVTAPAQVVLIRLLHPLLVTLGEIPGPAMILVLSAVGIVPCALCLGGLFVTMVGLAERSQIGAPISIVYGVEALGSGTGGLLLSFRLLEALNPVAIIMLAGITSMLSGLYLLLSTTPSGRRRGLITGAVILALLVLGLAVSPRLDLATRQSQWAPLKVIETVDTRYGNIVVTDRAGAYDFFESGVLAFTIPDPMYAEECVHIPLLHHPNPKSVLVIGATGSGIVLEVAKHPSVVRLDYVELDSTGLEILAPLAPEGWLEGDGITVTPVYGDGRRFMAVTPRHYDVVIINVGTPVTLQLNRYYTVQFFQCVKSVVGPNGVMALKIPSEGAYLGPELASLLSALVNSCRRVFEFVGLVPGEYIHLLASPGLDIGGRTDLLLETLSRRALDTSYTTEYVLRDRLSPIRAARLDSVIAAHDTGKINTDVMPISFSYSISLWAKHFRSGKIISFMVSRLNMKSCLLLLVLTGVVITATHMRAFAASRSGLSAAVAIYSMGLTAMFTEILIVLGFQIVSGYIYVGIAMIVAAFMLGMGLASSLAGTRAGGLFAPRVLPIVHCGLLIMPLVVVAVLNVLRTTGPGAWQHAPDVIFAVMAFITGGLAGTIFAVASKSLSSTGRKASDAGAISYSLDLTGACVAGFTTGLLIIPSLGLARSAYTVTIFNGIALIAILLGRKLLLRAPSH
ncbi:MAG: fused MFS/spermidine synthase [Candidatus Eisenbacteria bacterium]